MEASLMATNFAPAQRWLGLGLALVGLGIASLIPVFTVFYPAAGISQADQGNPAVVLPAVSANPLLFTLPGIVQIAAHAIGAVVVLGLWVRFGQGSFLLTCATLGGIGWMGIDIVDNAVAFTVVPRLAADYAAGSQLAPAAFIQLGNLTESVRFAAHFLGGLWMIGLSAFAIRARSVIPAVLAWLGVGVGAIFSANLFVPAALLVSFMTVPLWLVLVGAAVLVRRPAGEPGTRPVLDPQGA
jgi:hypothetical protein